MEKKKGRKKKGKYVKMQRPFQNLERPIGNCCSITVSQIDCLTTPEQHFLQPVFPSVAYEHVGEQDTKPYPNFQHCLASL